MAHAFTMWLGRLLVVPRPTGRTPRIERPPMKIEVECLPDYRWRELGFPPRQPNPE